MARFQVDYDRPEERHARTPGNSPQAAENSSLGASSFSFSWNKTSFGPSNFSLSRNKLNFPAFSFLFFWTKSKFSASFFRFPKKKSTFPRKNSNLGGASFSFPWNRA